MSKYRQINVLLAEDNPTDALLLKESLMDVAGIEFLVSHVERLDACLELLSRTRFDVILMDLGLPDSSGLETFRSLREKAPDLVVLVLTGLEDEETGIQAVKLGAEDYLMKSQVKTSLLGRIIRYAIERNHMRKALDERKEREAQDREVRSLERLSNAAATSVTAALYSGSAVQQSMPQEFQDAVLHYSRLLDVKLELRAHRTEETCADELRDLGNELGLLRATPRDIVQIHSMALRDKIRNIPLPKTQAYLEESRIVVLELMGYLAGFYRNYYTSAYKKDIRQ
jgi:DNA-binding NarL/FixJ family response regulator